MTAVEARFIEPLDVMILRGNKLFGEPGSYGEALIPPWPSVIAGAIRSRMLVDDHVDMAAFAQGHVDHPSLGSPTNPGSFTLCGFYLARRLADGRTELLVAPPADIAIVEDEAGRPRVQRAQPRALATGLSSSAPLPRHPVLAETQRAKPAGGYWLSEPGWKRYLQGGVPTAQELVKSSELWRIDERVGVGLSSEHRRAEDGQLFSLQAIALRPGIGFLATISGAMPPQKGLLRLGGDGRGAAIRVITHTHPQADFAAICKAGCCRMILTTPGLFAQGWLPHGIRREGDDYRFDLDGVRGRLVCAALARSEIISGWDLASKSPSKGAPKPAHRAAPTGSVYWLEDLEATPQALEKLVKRGLWSDTCENPARRAEGFNRFAIAVY